MSCSSSEVAAPCSIPPRQRPTSRATVLSRSTSHTQESAGGGRDIPEAGSAKSEVPVKLENIKVSKKDRFWEIMMYWELWNVLFVQWKSQGSQKCRLVDTFNSLSGPLNKSYSLVLSRKLQNKSHKLHLWLTWQGPTQQKVLRTNVEIMMLNLWEEPVNLIFIQRERPQTGLILLRSDVVYKANLNAWD